jgi:hypothetical protein
MRAKTTGTAGLSPSFAMMKKSWRNGDGAVLKVPSMKTSVALCKTPTPSLEAKTTTAGLL